MALPTAFPASFWSNRSRALEQQIVRQREQEARSRQQWELHSRYFRQSGQKEEDALRLEQRRRRLRELLSEEREMLAEELRALRLGRDEAGAARRKNEALKSAREERRRQIAEERLYERWKNNSAKLREVKHEALIPPLPLPPSSFLGSVYALPYKSDLLKALEKGKEVKEEETLEKIHQFLTKATPILDAIYEMYNKMNAELNYKA
ncbi:hypothetical protein JD844_015259 [Phrynosoma platyrhinos]|uniref:Trichoplein keratin filament-binding protein n=1 Tax=Phrynosoma platyrhinos TaxID=52577 RepID=A0ABQ7T7G7_PHRPL|nr:hypothetical protein JD844_015259 [Phrynosoma platyrhinos]